MMCGSRRVRRLAFEARSDVLPTQGHAALFGTLGGISGVSVLRRDYRSHMVTHHIQKVERDDG